MEWEKPFTKPDGKPRTSFKSLKVPGEFPVRDGQTLRLHVSFGDEAHTGRFNVSSGGEVLIPKNLADRIKAYAEQHPEASVWFREVRPGSDPLTDIAAAEPALASLPATERQTLIAARLGQGRFRIGLMRAWEGRCAVTGVEMPALLRASHIKPWCETDNRERLDPDNGLLLVATLDAAFDAKLISFDDDGQMLFSVLLGNPHWVLRAPRGARLTRQPSPRQQQYLAEHRRAAGL